VNLVRIIDAALSFALTLFIQMRVIVAAAILTPLYRPAFKAIALPAACRNVRAPALSALLCVILRSYQSKVPSAAGAPGGFFISALDNIYL
jgi:hypothetical protein